MCQASQRSWTASPFSAHHSARTITWFFRFSGADGLPAAGLYQRVLREVERPLITLTLQATQGNQIRAAEVLGLNRNTLRKKIRQLNIPIVRGAK